MLFLQIPKSLFHPQILRIKNLRDPAFLGPIFLAKKRLYKSNENLWACTFNLQHYPNIAQFENLKLPGDEDYPDCSISAEYICHPSHSLASPLGTYPA